MPKVSIILPTYNGEKYIRKAILSVLEQSFFDWELIVVDDASTTLSTSGSFLTREIVNGFFDKDERVVYLRNEKNLGIQKSLNRGLCEAKGEYVARIDDDDEWVEKDKLKRQVEFLAKNPDYVLVGTGVIVVNESGQELFKFLNLEKDDEIRKKILGKNCFSHSSVMFRKEIIIKNDSGTSTTLSVNYPETKNTLHAEDYYLWLKLGKQGRFYNLPIYGIKFMMRPGAIGSKHKLKQFWNDILIVWQFKKDYPNFLPGFLRSWLRFVLYGLGGFIPLLRLKYWIIKKYKNG
jgi:glycosyltransferase involved in cell wall biosynthesis